MYAGSLDLTQPLLWTIDGALSPSECAALIERIEAESLESAPIATAAGDVHDTSVRRNRRVIFDDPHFADILFERVKEHLPQQLLGARICGPNERLRCYRYEPGHYFRPHFDGSFARNEHERSLLTFLIYLNDGFSGGETNFPELNRTIVPQTGSALLFQHPILHEGCTVLEGVKYAIRSDIMYRKDR